MDTLFSNAIDSLETGMEFYCKRRFKYAYLLTFHSIELFLKECLRRQHEVLVYRDIDKAVKSDSPTVGITETLVRFKNVGVMLSEDEIKTIKQLQTKRNRIEHHRYDSDEGDRELIGQSLKFIMHFVACHLDGDFDRHISKDVLSQIEQEILDFDELMASASHRYEKWLADKCEGGVDNEDAPGTQTCPVCMYETLVMNAPAIGTYCFVCQKEIDAINCASCGKTLLRSEGIGKECESVRVRQHHELSQGVIQGCLPPTHGLFSCSRRSLASATSS